MDLVIIPMNLSKFWTRWHMMVYFIVLCIVGNLKQVWVKREKYYAHRCNRWQRVGLLFCFIVSQINHYKTKSSWASLMLCVFCECVQFLSMTFFIPDFVDLFPFCKLTTFYSFLLQFELFEIESILRAVKLWSYRWRVCIYCKEVFILISHF